jgi:hypothetical protein
MAYDKNIANWAAFELDRRLKRASTPEEYQAVWREVEQARRDPAFRARLAQIAEHGKWSSGAPGWTKLGLAAGTLAGAAIPGLQPLGLASGAALAGMAVPTGLEAMERRSEGLPWKWQAAESALDLSLPGASKLLRGLRGVKAGVKEAPIAFEPGFSYLRTGPQKATLTQHPFFTAPGVPKETYASGTAATRKMVEQTMSEELGELLPSTLTKGQVRGGGAFGKSLAHVPEVRLGQADDLLGHTKTGEVLKLPSRGFDPTVTGVSPTQYRDVPPRLTPDDIRRTMRFRRPPDEVRDAVSETGKPLTVAEKGVPPTGGSPSPTPTAQRPAAVEQAVEETFPSTGAAGVDEVLSRMRSSVDPENYLAPANVWLRQFLKTIDAKTLTALRSMDSDAQLTLVDRMLRFVPEGGPTSADYWRPMMALYAQMPSGQAATMVKRGLKTGERLLRPNPALKPSALDPRLKLEGLPTERVLGAFRAGLNPREWDVAAKQIPVQFGRGKEGEKLIKRFNELPTGDRRKQASIAYQAARHRFDVLTDFMAEMTGVKYAKQLTHPQIRRVEGVADRNLSRVIRGAAGGVLRKGEVEDLEKLTKQIQQAALQLMLLIGGTAVAQRMMPPGEMNAAAG